MDQQDTQVAIDNGEDNEDDGDVHSAIVTSNS
jgi:hypothetical protein